MAWRYVKVYCVLKDGFVGYFSVCSGCQHHAESQDSRDRWDCQYPVNPEISRDDSQRSAVPTGQGESNPAMEPPEQTKGKECNHQWHLHYPNLMFKGTDREHWEQEKRTCLKCGRKERNGGTEWYNNEEYLKEKDPPSGSSGQGKDNVCLTVCYVCGYDMPDGENRWSRLKEGEWFTWCSNCYENEPPEQTEEKEDEYLDEGRD